MRVRPIAENFSNGGTEHPSNRRAQRMTLHHPNEVRVGRRLKLVFRDFLNAIDQASTVGTVEQGLGIRGTELQVGDDVSSTDPDRESLKASRGAYGLAMNREMTRNGSRTLGHWTHPTYKNIKNP